MELKNSHRTINVCQGITDPTSLCAICTSPLVHVLTPALMRCHGPLFDSHLMTFWSRLQQTRALIKEELIHAGLWEEAVFTYVYVCDWSVVAWGPHSLVQRQCAISTPLSAPPRPVGTRSLAISPEPSTGELVLCFWKGKLRQWVRV